MTEQYVTLLVEDLASLVRAAPGKKRFPALERVVSKGACQKLDAITADHLRFALFGIESTGALPIAALTHVNDRNASPSEDFYWLRSDPVTLWADMASVFMSSHGYADLDPFERNEVENCIRQVLEEEGITLHGDHPERWCIGLNKPLDFDFPSLGDVVGGDISRMLPDHPEARYWNRLLNEIQVALHNCPVNIARRAQGRQEVNSVWFWGGGFIPEAAPHDLFDTVYSDNPVSRGLAIINDCRLKHKVEAELGIFNSDGRTILIDWEAESSDAERELQQAEWLSEPLVDMARKGKLELTLIDGQGSTWVLSRRYSRQFWHPNRRLANAVQFKAEK